jgi:polysaccharide chain length determinant protein (PEP-CTERM system associated)
MAAQTLGLHELYQQIKAIVYGIWRKRWYMVVTAWLISLVGWAAISTMPYRYEANARIFVDADSLLPQIAGNLGIDIDISRKIQAIQKTLVSRPNLETIIRRSTYLERLATNGAEMDALVNTLAKDIRIIALDEGLYRIQFEVSESRLTDRQRAEVARTVVANLLSFFRDGTSEGGGSDEVASASDLIEASLRDIGDRLGAAEAAHAKFKQDNIEFLGQINFATRLEQARNDLRATRSQIAELKVAQKTLERQLDSVPATIKAPKSSAAGGGGARDPLDERIAELQKKLDSLRSLGYLDRHPDVRTVSSQIKVLEQERAEKQKALEDELAGSVESGRTSSLTTETPNRLYEQLMLENINTLSQVSSLEAREGEQVSNVAALDERSKRVPEVEAEERALKRGYETLRRQHKKLLKEKEDLDLRNSIETTGKQVSFRVVENPVTPQKPSGPPRLLFMSAVFVGALFAGLGVSLVLSQLRPVVITVEQLRGHFDLPVLGNVTRSLSDEETRQRSIDMLGFAGATAMLFVVFAGFIVWDIIGAPTIG